jgi:hypothetical protein
MHDVVRKGLYFAVQGSCYYKLELETAGTRL